jgi:tetratricopeptide (TPR) repeat protein
VTKAYRLSLAALLLLFVAVMIQKIWSLDLWSQMAAGRWILQHHAWPRLDQFSYTVPTNEWVEVRWLFCVIAELLWRAGGAPAIILAKTLTLGAAFGLILWPRRAELATPAGVLVIGLALFAGSTRWIERPEAISYLLMAAFLVSLERSTHGRARWAVWGLPLLQVVWTNSHTLFVFGPVLAWMFFGADTVHRLLKRPKGRPQEPAEGWINSRLGLTALLVTIACLANPYGVHGATFPLILFREIQPGRVLAQAIGEFVSPFTRPIDRWTLDMQAGLVLFAVIAATFIRNWKKTDLARLGVFVSATYLAAVSQRNIGLFAIMAPWAALGNIGDILGLAAPAPTPESKFRRLCIPLAHVGLAALLVIASWSIATDRYSRRIGGSRYFGFGVQPGSTAEGAVDFVHANGCSQRIYHSLNDGSYLIWRGIPVYVDGRLEVYGEEFFVDYFKTAREGFEAWDKVATHWEINTVILQPAVDTWLLPGLLSSSQWAPVYLDAHNIVFVRTTPDHEKLIAANRIELRKPWTPRSPEPDERRSELAARLGAVGRPWYSEALAETFMAADSLDNAAVYLERAMAAVPDHERVRYKLAAVYRALGKDDKGIVLERPLLDKGPRPVWAEVFQARLLDQHNKPAAAIMPLERAVEREPTDRALRITLAHQYMKIQGFSSARAQLIEAIRLGHDTADDWEDLGLACQSMQELSGAIDAYSRCLSLDPARPVVLNRLGLLYQQQGEVAKAESYYQRALTLDPDFWPAKRNLDALHAKLQR